MTDELLERFLEEARELLAEASRALIALERQPGDSQLINTVFRSFHTMKGSSALFDLSPMTRMLHASEDLLHAVREGELALNAGLADLFFETIDQSTEWLAQLENANPLGEAAGLRADEMVARARDLGGDSVAAGTSGATKPEMPLHEGALPEWLTILSRAPEFVGESLIGIEYDPDPGCFFTGDDPLRLLTLIPGLLYLRILGHDELHRESDAFQCALRFRAVANCGVDELRALFLYVHDQVRFYQFSVGLDAEMDGCVRRLHQIMRALDEPPLPEVAAARRISYAHFARQALRAAGFPGAWVREFDLHAERAVAAQDDLFLRSALERVLQTVAAAGRAGMRLSMLPRPFASRKPEARASLARVSGAPIASTAPRARPSVKPAPPMPARPKESSAHVYKVDQSRIDALLDLAGELLVSKNALPYLARRAEGLAVPTLAREIKDQASTLARIADSFHHAVMQLRIIPLSHVFERFPRLVRDLSRQLGKNVQLVIEGEATEADKSTVEKLADPLIHILRNSLDHGLEPPEERVDAGKSEQGTISLRAKQERGALVVTIEDDGRGIDPRKVGAAAVRKGLLSRDELARLSDEDVINLIFRAGFSTKEQVSDLSGRGVGMDVVRTTVENSKGTVRVSSELGRGTRVVLSLPLSMAVTRVLLVESSGQVFGVPFELVSETVHVALRDVSNVRGVHAVTIRGRVVPIVHMAEMLGQARVRSAESDPLTVLVARLPAGDVGLCVDSLHEAVDVMLKPLEGPLANVRGYLGASLLGDGRALLILNLSELMMEESGHADSL